MIYGSRKEKLSADFINRKTYDSQENSNDITLNVARYTCDSDKERRLGQGRCKYCFYLRPNCMSLSAMTQKECDNEGCPVVTMYGSSDTDRFCKQCSDKHSICVECGSDLEFKNRRARK